MNLSTSIKDLIECKYLTKVEEGTFVPSPNIIITIRENDQYVPTNDWQYVPTSKWRIEQQESGLDDPGAEVVYVETILGRRRLSTNRFDVKVYKQVCINDIK